MNHHTHREDEGHLNILNELIVVDSLMRTIKDILYNESDLQVRLLIFGSD